LGTPTAQRGHSTMTVTLVTGAPGASGHPSSPSPDASARLLAAAAPTKQNLANLHVTIPPGYHRSTG
jgi:hypothetical protein